MKSLSFFLFLTIISCSSQLEQQVGKIAFSTRHLSLPVDTTIRSIEHLNGYLILLQDNGKIAVLDTNYLRVDSLESSLSKLSVQYLFRYNDSLFVISGKQSYYLKKDFTPQRCKLGGRRYGEVLFEDSIYLTYGCCVGEWGGSIFFLNKKTGRTYSYFATCPNQVLRFGKEYVVCNNLAHLSEHMSFLIVNDPTKLYEINDETLQNHCNWYTTIDSLKNYWQVSKVGDVRFYDAYDAMSLITFPFRDSLYSILSAPKATVLAVHRSDTTITVDTLINNKIPFHETTVIEVGNKKICLYKLTEGSPVAAYRIRGNKTGLIVVEGNRIDFLEKQKSK